LLEANNLVENKLNYLRERMTQPSTTLSSMVAEGHVCDSIVQEAKRWHADMIIIAARGHSSLERFLLGSVADGVLKKAPCSVQIYKTKISRKANHHNSHRALESV
jgi:nucleotide-binding universal stress UspA family protein